MAKALVPEDTFGAHAELVEVEFLGDGVDRCNDERRIHSSGGIREWTGREEKRLGVVEATGEDAMDHNVLTRTQVVVGSEGEIIACGVGVQRGASQSTRREQAFHGAGGNDCGTDFRCVEAVEREEAKLGGGRNAKDAMTGRSIMVTIGGDEAGAARVTWSIGGIGMEIAGGVRSGCLCTTIQMCPRTIKIMMEDGIDAHRSGFGSGKDLLEQTSRGGSR
jgi:hypothetical protein